MVRFQYQKQKNNRKSMLFSIVIFLCMIFLFFFGLNSVSARTETETQKSLESALQRGIVQCYALEGSYPESLEYLTKHYGISYDKNRFYVDYRVEGSNMMPDVTIIRKGD